MKTRELLQKVSIMFETGVLEVEGRVIVESYVDRLLNAFVLFEKQIYSQKNILLSQKEDFYNLVSTFLFNIPVERFEKEVKTLNPVLKDQLLRYLGELASECLDCPTHVYVRFLL